MKRRMLKTPEDDETTDRSDNKTDALMRRLEPCHDRSKAVMTYDDVSRDNKIDIEGLKAMLLWTQ